MGSPSTWRRFLHTLEAAAAPWRPYRSRVGLMTRDLDRATGSVANEQRPGRVDRPAAAPV